MAPTLNVIFWPAFTDWLATGAVTICGAAKTMMLNEQLTLLVPQLAVQVTIFVPMLNADPDGGEQVTMAGGVADGFGKLTTA